MKGYNYWNPEGHSEIAGGHGNSQGRHGGVMTAQPARDNLLEEIKELRTDLLLSLSLNSCQSFLLAKLHKKLEAYGK